MSQDMLPLVGVAAVVALAGTVWFRMVLKDWLLSQETPTRYGLYVLIWLAYFIAVMLIASRGG
ncbi:MAG: hypothetical protein AAFY22_14005 [Pseudomonadota bacterium]